jgi:hypothetical protein
MTAGPVELTVSVDTGLWSEPSGLVGDADLGDLALEVEADVDIARLES